MRRGSWRPLALAVAATLALVAATLGIVLTAGGSSVRPLAAGTRLTPPRQVPPLPLVTAAGRPTSLAAFHGRVVVLSPFLSLCSEVCPLTTGAFMQAAADLRRSGLAGRVVFVEVSVDPWRDSPARLRAFQRLIHARGVVMLTGDMSQLKRFWHFFGVWFARTAEGKPPDVDWWTHRPLRFDVSHTDELAIIGPSGRWQVADLGMPAVRGSLTPALRRLLNRRGLDNLARPQAPWTVAQLLTDLRRVAHLPVGG
jgi:cytochrome oxidase Cu insertion factor (SCO1/SenC/PrrC family)